MHKTGLFQWALAITLLVWVSCGESLAQTAEGWDRSGLGANATLDREIMVPMRDGVRLSTSIIRPKNAAEHLPTILIRTPYNRDGELKEKLLPSWISRGYAIVLQNERGTGWSEGKH